MTTQAPTTPNVRPAQLSWVAQQLTTSANTLVRGILRAPCHGLLSGTMLLLTFTGRKSGRRFTTPVTYLPVDETLLIFTDRPWAKNLEGGAMVSLRLRGREVPAQATVTADPGAVAQGIATFLGRKGLRNAWQIDLRLDTQRTPTADELRALVERDGRMLIRVTPEAL
ncbi:MAG TPA: nitroreductase/quinone reductase family protein [Chloroflexia bacterium]|nr:nitroreductase/quinone reductase family protein [Chloroflexia bacterium]